MANLTLTIWRDNSWSPADRVEAFVGTPAPEFFGASLATSSPSGGTLMATAPAWPDAMAQGGLQDVNPNAPKIGQALIGYSSIGNPALPLLIPINFHAPAGKQCGFLPIGVDLVDSVGNRSAILETKVQISDPPEGARNLKALASTDDPATGKARLTWTLSPDIEAA